MYFLPFGFLIFFRFRILRNRLVLIVPVPVLALLLVHYILQNTSPQTNRIKGVKSKTNGDINDNIHINGLRIYLLAFYYYYYWNMSNEEPWSVLRVEQVDKEPGLNLYTHIVMNSSIFIFSVLRFYTCIDIENGYMELRFLSLTVSIDRSYICY
ncbi:hypothetical protein J3Q64DRAFT_1696316 [Phycomyces blakesleeanus]|uniref:Uncharacterized protein n=2 Tax=Phycomyces blakesleeanus TaxID=4837 RepID=A0A162TQN9_PHYB8|nr:hypothetical protein PHYBLDRAFT_171686 [Phycomyces blakesleeanus NRRL 1555(-)]OAD70302.1 hypothetical protein PHYBLDRAFT_171686 [Phycomyces blakesleeanus NRRL 1555(-)]|eukprot:XP_018288342.1 hypothetical protein PHYBLDRAFT_171686 [Phycomyces blakesleeanus NRRL 1555(-)]